MSLPIKNISFLTISNELNILSIFPRNLISFSFLFSYLFISLLTDLFIYLFIFYYLFIYLFIYFFFFYLFIILLVCRTNSFAKDPSNDALVLIFVCVNFANSLKFLRYGYSFFFFLSFLYVARIYCHSVALFHLKHCYLYLNLKTIIVKKYEINITMLLYHFLL